jgi:hypothetical protein
MKHRVIVLGALGGTFQSFLKPVNLCVLGAVTGAALSLSAAASGGGGVEPKEFDEAHVFFELNNTDGDLGIHALIDGDAWRKLIISGPDDQRLLKVHAKGQLTQQGLTEIFFESAEPTFDELLPEDFFDRFDEGEYSIVGYTLNWQKMASTTQVSHLMPAPPVPTVNGEPMAQVCDDEDPDYDASEVSGPVTIEWAPVTMSHPSLGSPQSSTDIDIHNYQVVVEAEIEVDGDDFETIFSVILPPGQTSMTVPAEFLELTDTFKYEVLAREEGFNQTAVESCFEVD